MGKLYKEHDLLETVKIFFIRFTSVLTAFCAHHFLRAKAPLKYFLSV